MPGFFREHSWPIVFSVALHGLLAAALVAATLISKLWMPNFLWAIMPCALRFMDYRTRQWPLAWALSRSAFGKA